MEGYFFELALDEARRWVDEAIAFYKATRKKIALAEFSNPQGPFGMSGGAGSMGKERKLRILVTGPGPDWHDRGALVFALAFRDAGFEVIYTGCHQTPEQIVNTAIQESVDIIGLGILPGIDTYSFPRVLELLKENGAEDIKVIGEGPLPLKDLPKLKEITLRTIENLKPVKAMAA
jgi:methylmalonyl-CoA mutase C-terminal domain/subunit